MKLSNITFFTLFALCIIFTSCKKQANEPTIIDETLFYINPNQDLNPEIKSKFPDWIKKDLECYSFVKIPNDKMNTTAYPIKCKILGILRGGVKCRVLENTNYFNELKCDKYDVKVGAVWYETEGELYLTREATINKIKELGYFLMQKDTQ